MTFGGVAWRVARDAEGGWGGGFTANTVFEDVAALDKEEGLSMLFEEVLEGGLVEDLDGGLDEVEGAVATGPGGRVPATVLEVWAASMALSSFSS